MAKIYIFGVFKAGSGLSILKAFVIIVFPFS